MCVHNVLVFKIQDHYAVYTASLNTGCDMCCSVLAQGRNDIT